VKKIVSGGQAGADRAALDVAIEYDIPHGGWVPKGRIAEDGPIAERYRLKETVSAAYEARTEQNVLDSDGTLIVSLGPLAGGSAATKRYAKKHGRPFLHIDLNRQNPFSASAAIKVWMEEEGIETLNVAGPRASESPGIYDATAKLLKVVFHLQSVTDHMPGQSKAIPGQPPTVRQAVEKLVASLSLKDRAMIGNMAEEQLDSLKNTHLDEVIQSHYGLGAENRKLMEDCLRFSDKKHLSVEDAAALIMREVWGELGKTHRLRVVK
jgi:hypothetical protein